MRITVITTGKCIQRIMAEHLYLWGQLAGDDLHYIIGGESLIEGTDPFQYYDRVVFGLHSFLRMPAIITLTTIFIFIVLAEITHEQFPATHTSFGKGHCLINKLCTHFSFAKRLIAH